MKSLTRFIWYVKLAPVQKGENIMDPIIGQFNPFASKEGEDKVCPDFGHMMVPGKIVGEIQLKFFKCIKDKCAQWDEVNKRCGKIIAENGGNNGRARE